MKTLTRTFKSNTSSSLKLELETKNIGTEIIGWEKSESQLEIYLKDMTSDEEIPFEEIIKTSYDEKENLLSIKLNENDKYQKSKIKIKLFVPKITDLKAEFENGPLTLMNLQGTQIIKSQNSPLAMTKIKGEIDIEIKNGPINIKQCEAEVKLKSQNSPVSYRELNGLLVIDTDNGPINMTNCSGKLKVQSKNGPIKIIQSNLNEVDINSENGSIYYEFNKLEEGNFNFNNKRGKIQLIIPEDLPYDILAKNLHGTIRVSLKEEYEHDKTTGTQQVRMFKLNGKVKINLSNEYGSIVIAPNPLKFQDGHYFNFGDIWSNVSESIPEVNRQEIKESLNKARDAIGNINIPEIEKKIKSTLENVEQVLDRELNSQKQKEIFNKIKTKFDDLIRNANLKPDEEEDKSRPLSDLEHDREVSRLKILQLLQDGNISVEEAEKLLKATE